MAVFLSGHWRGTHYEVTPLGCRGICRFRRLVIPYTVGERVRFTMKITKRESDDSPRLNELQLYEIVPGYSIREVPTTTMLTSDRLHCEFTDEQVISEAGKVEYWLGTPHGADSRLLIQTDAYSTDKLIIAALFLIAGVIGGLIERFVF